MLDVACYFNVIWKLPNNNLKAYASNFASALGFDGELSGILITMLIIELTLHSFRADAIKT